MIVGLSSLVGVRLGRDCGIHLKNKALKEGVIEF